MNTTTNETATKFMAIDPATGCTVREATPAERKAYLTQPCRHPAYRPTSPTAAAFAAAFREPLRVGDVMIDEFNINPGHIDQGGWTWI